MNICLFTKQQFDQLIANGRKQNPVRGTDDEIDFKPLVKDKLDGTMEHRIGLLQVR